MTVELANPDAVRAATARATSGRRGERNGRRAEWWAALWLRMQGYQIINERFRCRAGEIDLIAKRDRQLVFVEVKYRRDKAAVDYALCTKQMRRITRAAEWFLNYRSDLRVCDIRFDVMLLRPWRLPEHLTNAWQKF